MEGKIWKKIIKREDLEENQQLFDILSSSYNQDNTLNIRVYALEKPSDDFVEVTPQLDDVYFIALKKDEPAQVV